MEEVKTMTVKQYLNQVRLNEIKIENLKERQEELYQSLLPSGIAYDKDKIQVSPTDSMSDKMAEIVDLYNSTIDAINELERLKNTIIEQIQNLTDYRQMRVLYEHYIRGASLYDISTELNYTYKWVCKIHLFALQEFGKINTLPEYVTIPEDTAEILDI